MRLAFACLLVLLSTAPAAAQPAEVLRLFDEGNQQYRAGAYEAARDTYTRVLNQGYASAALYYNLGNAYYRLDELGQAVRYYEKARRLRPDQPELAHNLRIVQSRTQDQFSRLPEPFWRPAWMAVVRGIGPFVLFALGLLAYAGAAGLVIYRLQTHRRGPWLRRALTASVVLGALLLGAAFRASIERTADPAAVVLADEAALHQAPTTSAEVELSVHEGLLLDVLQRSGDWAEVRLPNGVTGWIEARVLAEV